MMKGYFYVILSLTIFATPMAEDILVEGFESGTLPSGWQVWEEAPYYWSWYFNAYVYPHMGSYSAYRSIGVYYPDDGYPGDDSWLVTPTLDMSTYQNLSFSCWYSVASDMGNRIPEVYLKGTNVLSPDPGDFVELLDMGEAPNGYEERIADASLFAGDSDVTFAIHYLVTGPTQGGYDAIFIDDVLVSDDIAGIESASFGGIKAIYR